MNATLDDRLIADTVNLLRDIAIEFHDAQQLRERIAGVVVPLLKVAQSTEMMADCMNMVREELIEAGIIDKTVPPMMVSNAVVAYVSRIINAKDALVGIFINYDGATCAGKEADEYGTVSLHYKTFSDAEASFELMCNAFAALSGEVKP